MDGIATDPTKAALDAVQPPDYSRAKALERYEALFNAMEYEGCLYDFDARPMPDSGAGGAYNRHGRPEEARSVPYGVRKPMAPSRLGRTIVKRFTSKLFSPRHRPQLRVLGDPDTNDWVEGAVQASEFWKRLAEGRNRSGSIGTSVVSWAMHAGHPVLEVHNARLVTPTWADRARSQLSAITISFDFPRSERQPNGTTRTVWYVYRRTIDITHDRLYEPWQKKRGKRPDWQVRKEVEHGFVTSEGAPACPAVWVQNTPDSEAIDGEPDYYGQEDAIEEYDRSISHALRGTGKNCDPTPVIGLGQGQNLRDGESVQKGSDNAIVLNSGGSANYMEMAGGGIAHARQNAEVLKANILEACDCVLDSETTVEITATEVRDRRDAMNARIDLYRGQWEPAIVQLLTLLIDYARRVEAVRYEPAEDMPLEADADGEVPPSGPPLVAKRGKVIVPPKVVQDSEDPEEPAQIVERQLGSAERYVVSVQWPDHAQHQPSDVAAWQQTLSAAADAGWIDTETAAMKWAGIADIANARAAFVKGQRAAEQQARALSEQQAALSRQLLGQVGPEPDPDNGPDLDVDPEGDDT